MDTNNMEQPTTSWTITVEEDPDTGELILPLPADFLVMQGWFEGDELEWTDLGDGTWTLSKIDKTPTP
jgi:hypothetical protein